MSKLTIDNGLIIYNGSTYPVRAITSVTTSKDVSKGPTGCAVTLAFGTWFLFGFVAVFYVLPTTGMPVNEVVRGIGTLIVFIVALWGAQQVTKQKVQSYYYIHLHMAGGEEVPIKNDTAAEYQERLDAINLSISRLSRDA